jgi:hypothetical protein
MRWSVILAVVLLGGLFILPATHHGVPVAQAEVGGSDGWAGKMQLGANPERSGIEIILTVYSGRPNPTWRLAEGPEAERLLVLVRALDVNKEKIFDYDEWNRLGYATFWIVFGDTRDAPYAVQVWRDMAYVIADVEAAPEYAVGASDLYEYLVVQAEARDQGAFFVNYRRAKQE